MLLLAAAIFKYGSEAVVTLKDIQAKTNVMWAEYAKLHPDAEAVMQAYHYNNKAN